MSKLQYFPFPLFALPSLHKKNHQRISRRRWTLGRWRASRCTPAWTWPCGRRWGRGCRRRRRPGDPTGHPPSFFSFPFFFFCKSTESSYGPDGTWDIFFLFSGWNSYGTRRNVGRRDYLLRTRRDIGHFLLLSFLRAHFSHFDVTTKHLRHIFLGFFCLKHSSFFLYVLASLFLLRICISDQHWNKRPTYSVSPTFLLGKGDVTDPEMYWKLRWKSQDFSCSFPSLLSLSLFFLRD